MSEKCIAMLLAGGQGSRLQALTKNIAKPAVSFGGKYRMIDFSLSNCSNSEIKTVGVLTQYRPFRLNSYVGNGSAWNFNSMEGGVYILPPYATEEGGEWYQGTADAIYQNLEFIDMYDPDYVLILSGDHLYRMDYRKMLESHIANHADVTISCINVTMEEASRFGIVSVDDKNRITKFTEKPKKPESTLASMGIYIFNKDLLKRSLVADNKDKESEHDFGKNIIPGLLAEGKYINCYEFNGFWRDVGTIPAYYETSMELLDENPKFDLFADEAPILSNSNIFPPEYIGPNAELINCMANNGCRILGKVQHSIVSLDCYVGEGAIVEDSILLPGAVVESGARVTRSIVGEGAIIPEKSRFGNLQGDISVLGNNVTYKEGK